LNTIELLLHKEAKYEEFRVLIDGLPLHKHFVGRTGSHPSSAFSGGGPLSSENYLKSIVAQLLGEIPSCLASGRVPLLVCEECGDVACGAIAAHISVEAEFVIWSDWKAEDGSSEPSDLMWPTCPDIFTFSRAQYEKVIRAMLVA
jgi:hypothetical protein